MKTGRRNRSRPGTGKILIPVGKTASKRLIAQALHVFSVFKNPLVVLFTVIEVPSRTATLETEPYTREIGEAEKRLSELASWLRNQGMKVNVKVVVARNIAEGIIDETQSDGYLAVFLMRRKPAQGWRRVFSRSVTQRVVRTADCLVMTAPLE